MPEKPARVYAHSLPFKPPEQLAKREAQLRRWSFLLGFGTVTVIVSTVAVSIVLVNRATRKAELALEKSAPFSARDLVRSSALSDPNDREDSPDDQTKKDDEQVRPDGENKTRPASSSTESASPMPRERVLEVLGGLAAAHLYQSYLNIGLLADARENDLYSDAEAKDLLAKITAVIDTVDEQLAGLFKSHLQAEDQKALERTRELNVLLRSQAKELKAYWESGAKEDANRFHLIREKAWIGIHALLNVSKL